MRLWSLFIVAWMPVLQVLLIGLLGAFLASDYCNILKPDARKNTNKVVYCVCVPALVFSSLASTVTLKDIVSWWFMPVNIGITFLIGATLGWLAVKIIRPGEHFRGLVVACSSAGNWGTLPLMIVPAICNEEDSPFGDAGTCNSLGRSYVSFSMALGNFYIWTYSYHIMKKCAIEHYKNCKNCGPSNISDNEIFGQEAKDSYGVFLPLSSNSNDKDEASYSNSSFSPSTDFKGNMINYLRRTKEKMREMLEEFWSPPTIAAVSVACTVYHWIIESYCNADTITIFVAVHRIHCWCNTQAEITYCSGRCSSWSSPRFGQIIRRGYNALHYPHTRQKPIERYWQDGNQALGRCSDYHDTLHDSPCLWNWHCQGSWQTWFSAAFPSLSVRTAITIHRPPGHGYRYNCSAV